MSYCRNTRIYEISRQNEGKKGPYNKIFFFWDDPLTDKLIFCILLGSYRKCFPKKKYRKCWHLGLKNVRVKYPSDDRTKQSGCKACVVFLGKAPWHWMVKWKLECRASYEREA